MKIAIFSPYFHPHKGGVENFTRNVAKRLSKSNDILLISSKFSKEKSQERLEGYDIIRIDSWDLLGNAWPLAKPSRNNVNLYKKIGLFEPDIIITNTRFFPQSYRGMSIAKKLKAKHIHIEHGTSYVKLKNPITSLMARIYDKLIGSVILKNADLVIGVSEASEKFAIKLGAKKTTVIPNSVDTSYFSSKKDLVKEKTTVSYTGRLIFAKGVHDLISSFKQINSKNIQLLIAGKGNYEKNLKELARDDKRITFLGELDKPSIKDMLNNSDIFVNPSYSEGLPTSVLEAGSMDLAIIATDVGGTKEIIDDKKNGLIIEARNPKKMSQLIEKLIKDKTLAKQYGDRIREKVRREYDWDKNIKKLQRIFTKI